MRMLITGYAFTMTTALACTTATAQPSLSTRAEVIPPRTEAAKDKQPAQVLCVPQTPGAHAVVVPMHPTIRTRWKLLEPVMNFDLGNASDYNKNLDLHQRKRLSIQPLSGASPTNLVIETSVTRNFTLKPVKDPAQAIHLVLVIPEDPDTGEMVPDQRCQGPRGAEDDQTMERMEQGFEIVPAKTGRWESDGFALQVKLSEQYHEGDTMKCRYTVENEGLDYQIKGIQFVPTDTRTPLTDVTIALDGDKRFPVELPHGAAISGSMHVKEGAGLLKSGFKLHLIPARPGILAAPVGFKDPEPNEGRLSVQVQGVGGTIELRNSAGQTDFTTLFGAGGRFVFGFNKYVSVEGSASIATTGDARFGDGTTTKATMARLLAGGVLHFGDQVVPYLRGGIGARVSNYDAIAGEAEWRGSGLLSVGGGVDVWFGDNAIVGFSVGYLGPLGGGSDESFSFEAGIHAGYAWKR